MQITVFYSWQNDLPSKINRYFIKDCLEVAINQLNKDYDVFDAVRLDSDTANVPGTPDITSTIFNKISNSQIFVADLSFCSQSKDGKQSPNPNVLLELGYALALNSDKHIVNVMNRSYGDPDLLPFDLRHRRWPISYALTETDSEDSTKKAQCKKKLVSNLHQAIKLIITSSAGQIESPARSDGPSLDYVNSCISGSEPRQDWEMLSIGAISIATYKNDVNLRIQVKFTGDGIQCDDFQEEWANNHLHPKATGYWCDIYYAATLVERSILVAVDEGRALLPVPRQKGSNDALTEVLPFDYQLASIFDSFGNLSHYMYMSGLSLAGKVPFSD